MISFLSDFAELRECGPEWLQDLRQNALNRFEALGFPTPRDEEWKYTNVTPLSRQEFRSTNSQKTSQTAISSRGEEALQASVIESLVGPRLVFVDGIFSAALSRVENLPKDVELRNFASALQDSPSLKRRLAAEAKFDDESFVALNTAFMHEGLYAYVPRGVTLAEPVHVLFVSTGDEPPHVTHPRHLIVTEDNAQLTLIEDYVGLGDAKYWTNAVTEVFTEPGSIVDHYKLVRESDEAFHVSNLCVRQSRESKFHSSALSFGGALVRNNVNVVMDDEGVECTLNGLTTIGGRQHVDNHTRIVHAKPRCNSWEVYKNILSDRATGVFNGKIYVNEDAQKTDAKQTNQTLLLSDSAVMNTKPELEIYADDVKCTHGATIGQLDKDALFYLQARGVGAEAARALLTYAFAGDVVDSIRVDALRRTVQGLMLSKLPEQYALETS